MKSKKVEGILKFKYFWIIIMLILWEGVSRFTQVNPLAFPSLETIGESLIQAITTGEILGQMAYSVGTIALGLGIAAGIALIFSFLSIYSTVVDTFTDTCISLFHPLPGIALLPLIILWFGTGSIAIHIIIIHSVLWPMLLNTKSGFMAVPEIYRKIGMNYELSMSNILFKIFLPASLPFGLAGLKIGWARAWRAAISAEMVFGATGGKGGIGWYIFNKRVFMDTPGLFAGLFVIIIIGILIEDFFFGKLEKETIKKWGISQ